MNYVYWIYDETCIDITRDGYVGVTKDVNRRFRDHCRHKRVPENAKIKVVMEGTRQECFYHEKQLRPESGIGWNRAIGGAHGWQNGFSHSETAKSKMAAAWTDERRNQASKWKTEHNRSLKGQKRPKQSEALKGTKNPMYGTSRPDYVKEAVSKAHKGKTPANKQEIYCIGCHQRVSLSILNKYHGKCIK